MFNRAPFPYIDSIKDEFLRGALRVVFDRIQELSTQGEREGTQLTSMSRLLDMNGNRIIQVGRPEEEDDAITKEYADGRYQKILRTGPAASVAPVSTALPPLTLDQQDAINALISGAPLLVSEARALIIAWGVEAPPP